jgi:hypothetical protein
MRTSPSHDEDLFARGMAMRRKARAGLEGQQHGDGARLGIPPEKFHGDAGSGSRWAPLLIHRAHRSSVLLDSRTCLTTPPLV